MEPFQTGSTVQRLFAGVLILVTVFVPLAAAVRIVMAPFSQRVRDSISRHKLVHVVWFVAAAAMTFFALAPFIFTAKMKGL